MTDSPMRNAIMHRAQSVYEDLYPLYPVWKLNGIWSIAREDTHVTWGTDYLMVASVCYWVRFCKQVLTPTALLCRERFYGHCHG